MIARLLFEQSGTFKRAFKSLGFNAYDYDIENTFNETDYVINLFDEIVSAKDGVKSIFDDFTSDDIIFAFFPCTRFETQIIMCYNCTQSQCKDFSDLDKVRYNNKLMGELYGYMSMINMLVEICLTRNLKLIIENPYSSQHFLTRYWCFKPSIIDYDRSAKGDYFVKPTQYWFFNCKPKDNFVFECVPMPKTKKIDKMPKGIGRSLISDYYASRFIREYVL